MTPQELKNSILQLAIQGKLVEQRPEEGTAEELFARIQKEKQRLIKEGKIKKEKSLPEITEDEKPFEIPESWKWVRVGNCGSWGAGATPSRTNSEYYGGTIPWLKTGDLNDGVIVEIPEYITELALGKRFVKGKLHLMSHGYLNFVLMSVLPSLWHNKVSYAIINYLEDKFIVTGGEGCRVGKLSGAKSIPPRSFSKRTFKNLFWICCGCRQDLCYAGGRSPGSKQRDRRCCGLH